MASEQGGTVPELGSGPPDQLENFEVMRQKDGSMTFRVAIVSKSPPAAKPSNISADAASSLPFHPIIRMKRCGDPLNPPVKQAVYVGIGPLLEATDIDDRIRAIMTTGADDVALSAGMNLQVFASGD